MRSRERCPRRRFRARIESDRHPRSPRRDSSAEHSCRIARRGRRSVVVSCTEGDFRNLVGEHLKAQSLMQEILDGGEFYRRAVETIDGTPQANSAECNENVHELEIAGEQAPIIGHQPRTDPRCRGRSRAACDRSCGRNPDVVFVGEMRDTCALRRTRASSSLAGRGIRSSTATESGTTLVIPSRDSQRLAVRQGTYIWGRR